MATRDGKMPTRFTPRPDHDSTMTPPKDDAAEVSHHGRADDPMPSPDEGIRLVACGASAGGLEAFSQLVSSLPSDLGAAVIFVQHLAADHESLLASLLRHHTAMTVVEAHDGVTIERAHIYVAPPASFLDVRDGALRVSRGAETTFHPIDHLFRSLADRVGDRAIAVVLSGTGGDGAIGIRDVRAVGGITMAQDPSTAKYDGMPQAAIATGAVDVVQPPAGLAAELARITRQPAPSILPGGSLPSADAPRDEHLQRVFVMLRSATGVDFRQYKMPTIERRLQRRLVLHKMSRLEDYVRLLREHADEVLALYRDILIHVTRFFREPDSYRAMAEYVFRRIIEDHEGDTPIRCWVAGCSTGEEVYSLAITLLEALGDRVGQIPVQIFATDVSEEAIQHARTGAYSAAIAADVSPDRLHRFFTKHDGGYRIAKPVRDLCVFARQDITRDPPFSRLDLILCRNVMIYLSAPLQRRLMSIFHYALRTGRFLVLGHAETIGSHADLFQLEDRRHRVYSKKGAELTTGMFSLDYSAHRMPSALPVPQPRDDIRTVQNEVNRVLLDRFAPAGVVVDDDMQVVHFRGKTGPYLEPAAGEPSLHLFKMAREGLLHGLRMVMAEARRTGRPAQSENMRVKQNGGWHTITVEVLPLHGADKRHFLVLFTPSAGGLPTPTPAPAPPPSTAPSGEGEDRVRILEEELAASRHYLQSIIQELEAANEELQSANEEILSSNEELQSTNEELDTAKEELQSTNEELNTVNDELHGGNEELSRANSDLMNVLSSVQIAILIVSSDLRIRRFTPMAERTLNLIATDVGRPIAHIKPGIDCPDLEQLIHEAIDTVSPVEREVRDPQGHWFALRIRPYKGVDNRIDGAVLSLFDVDSLRRQEIELREMRHYAEAVVDMIRQPLVVLEADNRVRTANGAFRSMFGSGDSIVGQPFFEMGGGAWNAPTLRALLARLSSGPTPTERIDVSDQLPRLRSRHVTVDARRIEGPDGRPPLLLLTFEERPQRASGDA